MSLASQDESYLVYSAAISHQLQTGKIPHHGDGRGPDQSKISQQGYQACMAQLRPQPETQAGYESANRNSHRLRAKFTLPNCRLLDSENSTKADAATAMFLSSVGFNNDRTQALVTLNFQWYSLDCLLEKSPDHGWAVIRESGGRGGMERAD